MQRWQLTSGYTKLSQYLKNLPIEPSTDYVLEFELLGGELDLYLLPPAIAAGDRGIQHLPAAVEWTPVRLEFSTAASQKAVRGFGDWGIGFLKTVLDPFPRSCIYSDTYLDNLRLYPKNAPQDTLLEGGDFEDGAGSTVPAHSWQSDFFKNGRQPGVDIVTDPLNAENRCLLLPRVIQPPPYPKPMPVEAAGFGWLKQSRYNFPCISFTGKSAHHLLLVKSGAATATVENTAFTLENDTLLYIPPHTPVHYLCNGGETTEYYWLELTGDHVPSLLAAVGLNEPRTVSLQDCSALTVFIDAMLFLPTHTVTYSLALSGQLQLLLNELERQLTSSEQTSPHRLMIESIAVLIRRYPAKAQDNDELAAQCGLSTNYFIRLFKEIVGTSPQQYRIRFLVQRACTLLQDPDITIQEIAYSLGIDDPLYFSRLFRSVQGVSPRQYRKQWQAQWGEKHIENN